MEPDKSDTNVMKRGNLTMDPQRHTVQWKGIHVALTITEFLLLQALAIRPGFVKSRDQLMDVAYGDQVYVDDRTIDSHVKRLRKKMRVADESFTAIETLYGIGYRYNDTWKDMTTGDRSHSATETAKAERETHQSEGFGAREPA